MLDKVALCNTTGELLACEEVVVDTVLLPGSRPARGGRDRQLELGDAREQSPDQGALSDPRRARDDEDLAQRRRISATSSPRWRSDRPPTVLLGEILHWPRILFTFTRPYLGTASSRSNTLAVAR